jgi:hypothetical protein
LLGLCVKRGEIVYKAYIGVISEKKEIEKVCEDIKKKDSTFSYEIRLPYKNLRNKFKWFLLVFDGDKNSLNQRAGWFIHKMKNAKVADYYWVRKVPVSRGINDQIV